MCCSIYLVCSHYCLLCLDGFRSVYGFVRVFFPKRFTRKICWEVPVLQIRFFFSLQIRITLILLGCLGEDTIEVPCLSEQMCCWGMFRLTHGRPQVRLVGFVKGTWSSLVSNFPVDSRPSILQPSDLAGGIIVYSNADCAHSDRIYECTCRLSIMAEKADTPGFQNVGSTCICTPEINCSQSHDVRADHSLVPS